MSNEIKVEKQAVEKKVAVEGGPFVIWQFRYKNYMEILNIIDPEAPKTASGISPHVCVEARNWRVKLDLSKPRDKAVNDGLMASRQRNVSFWMLEDVASTDKISDRAKTLEEIMKMPEIQLRSMVTDEEIKAAGLMPGHLTKMQLMMLVIDQKKLV